MSPRPALAAGLLAAALGTAGCGADVSIGDPTSSPPAPTSTAAPSTTAVAPTPEPTGSPGSGPTGSATAGALPSTFPLPPGTSVTRSVSEGGQLVATLSVPDGKQVYAYWTSALPAAGYRVGSSEMVGGIGVITFTGPGCPGDSQIGINDEDVIVRCGQG